MAPPKLRTLTEAELEQIEAVSFRILEEIGIKFNHRGAIALLKRAGAKVDEENLAARIPRELVRECLKSAPKDFTLYARDPAYDHPAGGRNVNYGTISGAKFCIAHDTGDRRECRRRDQEVAARVIDACEHIMHLSLIATPQEVMKEAAYHHSADLCLKFCRKHLRTLARGAESTREMIAMAEAAAGGAEELRRRPFISFMELTTPPFGHDMSALDGAMEGARRNFPVWISSGPITGAASPVTLAGTMALVNAEVLSSIVVLQLVNPGVPVLYGSFARMMDLKTTQVSLSSPEWCLMRAATADLARLYGLPSFGGSVINASKTLDIQAGYEKGTTLLMMGLAGLNLPSGMLLDCQNSFSPEDLVINNEVVSYVKWVLRGMEVNDESLAFDVMREIGPGGMFFRSKHTLKHYKTELWVPDLSDRWGWDDWVKAGRKDMVQRAHERVEEILASPVPAPLSEKASAEMDRILASAEERLSKMEEWSEEFRPAEA